MLVPSWLQFDWHGMNRLCSWRFTGWFCVKGICCHKRWETIAITENLDTKLFSVYDMKSFWYRCWTKDLTDEISCCDPCLVVSFCIWFTWVWRATVILSYGFLFSLPTSSDNCCDSCDFCYTHGNWRQKVKRKKPTKQATNNDYWSANWWFLLQETVIDQWEQWTRRTKTGEKKREREWNKCVSCLTDLFVDPLTVDFKCWCICDK